MVEDIDDDEVFEGLYEGGYWIWDDKKMQLAFESNCLMTEDNYGQHTTHIFGPIEFKDDIDPVEQHKFRKRFQRRSEGDEDVILLQDVIDVVLYTAPNSIVTPMVVSMLHLSTSNRFLRALIFYFQYFLQVSDQMARRMLELETKIRTPRSLEVELELRDNLEDLRLLVAKEYCTMILGGADFKRLHHMGPSKKLQSLTKKDSIVFESVLRICMQIVWLALGRQSLNQIEIETHRMFKSQLFNIIEHRLNTNYVAKMAPYERNVLLGHCVNVKQKLNMLSPLMNEIQCHRKLDYRIFGLGILKMPGLSPRLRYMENTLSLSERLFQKHGVTLGIIGQTRSRFDTMLRAIKMGTTSMSSTASLRAKSLSRTSRVSMRKSTVTQQNLYPDIFLPSKCYDDKESLPEEFPRERVKAWFCNPVQRFRWRARAMRLAGKHLPVNKRYHNLKPIN